MPLDPYSAVLVAAVGAIAAAYVVTVVVWWPHLSLWLSFAALMWPTLPIAARVAVIAALGAGAAIRGVRGTAGGAVKPLVLYLCFAAVMTFGLHLHGMPAVVSAENTQNSFVVMLVSLAVVPITAVLRPPLVPTLKALALSGALASAYTLLVAEKLEGRALLDNYNPDAVGLSAAAAALVAIALFVLLRELRWLALAGVPMASLVAAQARSALVVLALGLAMLWLLRRSSGMRVVSVAALVALAPFLADAATKIPTALFTSRAPGTYEVGGRVDALRLAGQLVIDHPLFGIGWRHFTDESVKHLGVIIEPHNDYARIAAEGGMVALVLLLALVGRLVTFRNPSADGRVLRAVGLAVAAALLFSNTITDLRVVLPLWVLLGIAWTVGPAREDRRGGGSGDGVVDRQVAEDGAAVR